MATMIETPQLTARDQRILAFESRWWRLAGAKESAIRTEFGMSATRYYQVLNQLLDRPAAQAAQPALVKRLRHLRDGYASVSERLTQGYAG